MASRHETRTALLRGTPIVATPAMARPAPRTVESQIPPRELPRIMRAVSDLTDAVQLEAQSNIPAEGTALEAINRFGEVERNAQDAAHRDLDFRINRLEQAIPGEKARVDTLRRAIMELEALAKRQGEAFRDRNLAVIVQLRTSIPMKINEIRNLAGALLAMTQPNETAPEEPPAPSSPARLEPPVGGGLVTLEDLIKDLGNADPTVRQAATDTLVARMKANDDRVALLRALDGALRSSDPEVVVRAQFVLDRTNRLDQAFLSRLDVLTGEAKLRELLRITQQFVVQNIAPRAMEIVRACPSPCRQDAVAVIDADPEILKAREQLKNVFPIWDALDWPANVEAEVPLQNWITAHEYESSDLGTLYENIVQSFTTPTPVTPETGLREALRPFVEDVQIAQQGEQTAAAVEALGQLSVFLGEIPSIRKLDADEIKRLRTRAATEIATLRTDSSNTNRDRIIEAITGEVNAIVVERP